MLTLVIGNKNYSSWSMRPWVLMRQAGIEFEERLVRFDSFDAHSVFKTTLTALSPLGKVPVLIDSDIVISDSLAIAEYLAERFPNKHLWPTDTAQRAHARSLCAEMHAGFSALRRACPMNIEANLADVGAQLWQNDADLRADVARLETLWSTALQRHGGPMLMGGFSIVDAFYAPVCMRLRTYALPVSDAVRAYTDRVTALPSVAAWIQDALAENDFVPFDEPYRDHPRAAP